MYQVIARKYRPRHFAELIGQEHVRATLANAISKERIAHGYIFSGQRGTGKTTVARILARCLNCEKGPTAEPCLECAACTEIAAGASIDVIEIDAASNRGINEMRELRENVRFRPARDRFKVFIIDEAHQITNEAFNALLKTLEEPPDWVVFVLCTTESHKIPTTIASRCQQFSFRSVEFGELVDRMRWICEQEGIASDEGALAVLAQAGEGSVRDSLSALDQAIACCGNELNVEQVRELLGLFSLDSLGAVTEALAASDSNRMLGIVQELERNGANLQHYTRELARYFRNLLVAKIAGTPSRLIAATPAEQEKLAAVAQGFGEEDLTRFLQLTLDIYRDLQHSLQPRLHLELGLLRLVHAGKLVRIEEALASLGPAAAPTAPPASAPPTATRSTPPARQFAPPAAARPVAAPPPPPARPPVPASGSLKDRLLAHLAAEDMKAYVDAVEHAEFTENASEIRLSAPKEFGLALKSADIRDAVQKLLGRAVKINFIPATGAATGAASGASVAAPSGAAAAAPSPGDDPLTQEALGHPEVQRFQQTFPGSHVRTVRNLRD
ncbi:MAG: DNA polymerase III subunit gamma/tau [Bryobacterales bacterium]|nr:DNA polymerase III subunit gamma/tau [Bryobacterales bacterium]